MKDPHVTHDARDDEPTGDADVTGEVGSEGGSEGELEVEIDRGPSAGSEAGETVRPAGDRHPILRDERGSGKRSP